MTRNYRSVAALLVLGGVVLGILLTSGLRWTDATTSEPRQLNGSQADMPPELQALQAFNNAFSTVAQMAGPSVVTITSERVVRPTANRDRMPENHPFREFFGDDFLDRFWHGPREEFRAGGLGSGVIVSPDGYILTNNHVIDNAETIRAVLADDREFEAEVVGTDPESDLALLKVDGGEDFEVPRFGDSDQLAVGEWVLAVGSPFNRNLRQTVTAGIVSATGRTSVGIVDFEDFIQTDAAINPGNSGGALMNLRGELIGINTAIATRTGSSAGVGFAIPINMARSVMDDLLNKGHVVRGWLGVIIQSIDEDLAEGLELDSKHGVIINDLTPDGPADRAGVERGDVVLELDGTEVRDADHLQNLVAERDPGQTVTIRVDREGRRKTIDVRLGERPSNPREAFARGGGGGDGGGAASEARRLGLELRDLDPSLASELGYEDVEDGVVVTDIESASAAAKKNIRRGDLILEVNRTAVAEVEDVERALEGVEIGEPVLLLLRRGQTTFFTAIKLPAEED